MRAGAQVKVNDSCEFPMELNMRPYTKEGLLARQHQQKQREGEPASDCDNGHGKGVAGGEGEGSPDTGEAFPDAYYEYKLAGVLVHTGTADSGHYYSYIKRRDMQVGGGVSCFVWSDFVSKCVCGMYG